MNEYINLHHMSPKKVRFSLTANISTVLMGLLPNLWTALKSFWSLLLNGHQDVEDWPKNDGARANVKAGLKTI